MVAVATKETNQTVQSDAKPALSPIEQDQRDDDAITSEHHIFTPDEYARRRSVGYKVEDANVRKEIIAKELRVKNLKGEAGTFAARKAAKDAADKAATKRRSRIDKIKEEIAERELELNEIAKFDDNGVVTGHLPTAEESTSKAMHAAADELRKEVNLPPYIIQQYRDAEQVCNHRTYALRAQLGKLKSELHRNEAVSMANANISPSIRSDQETLIAYGHYHSLTFEVQNRNSSDQKLKLGSDFVEHLKELDQQREAIAAQIAELETEIAGSNGEAKAVLDFHLKRIS